jgi:hypothetical protein
MMFLCAEAWSAATQYRGHSLDALRNLKMCRRLIPLQRSSATVANPEYFESE